MIKGCGAALVFAIIATSTLPAQAAHYSLGYDQPHTTAYGIAADLFAAKLSELSKGTMEIDQFPGASWVRNHRCCRKSEPETSTLSSALPPMQPPYRRNRACFRSISCSARKPTSCAPSPILGWLRGMQDMFADTVKDAHVLTLLTLGLRNLYGKKEIHSIADIKNLKVRVQATPTEDAMFPAYGAQTVHMPFGSVYTSLQTGVVDMAENGINVYDTNKHYEVAPIMSLTGHEANANLLWISGKLWDALTAEQKGWVEASAKEVATKEPTQAIALEAKSRAKLEKLGVKFVADVDKSGFIAAATPLQDKIAADLGPHAIKILEICREIQ